MSYKIDTYAKCLCAKQAQNPSPEQLWANPDCVECRGIGCAACNGYGVELPTKTPDVK